MRIFFIVDETHFFLPQWLNEVVKAIKKGDSVVGITPLITKNAPTFYNHLIKNIIKIGLLGLLKLMVQGLIAFSNKPNSIRGVAKLYQIPIIDTQKVNDPEYLKRVKNLKPDLIISSCSQIFGHKLLNIPKIACINRHSALLPSYGGVFPLFWAMLKNEKKVGVTIHHMIQKIDKGKVIYQKEIQILQDESLFGLYRRVYRESAPALIKAINIIKMNKAVVVVKGIKPSYYSFPTKSDWEKYFKMRYKFI